MKTFLPLLLFVLCTFIVNSQDYHVISGQLLDQKTGKGVPYANIGIPQRGIGTTSNDDGQFTFKVPSYYSESKLIVSVIGYKTFERPLRDFGSTVIIDLEPTSYSLSEVQITDENGVENIIRKAVARIPDNYPTYPTNGLAFYRESRTNKDDKYRYLAEGVLNIYKSSYENTKDGMVGLVQARKINMENPLDTTVSGGFSSGHMAAHRFDFVKNREDFIDEDFFKAYRYWIESITTYNGKEVYVIGFSKDPDAKGLSRKKTSGLSFVKRLFGGGSGEVLDARLDGKVFIEKESYAFIRAEFHVSEKGLERFDDYPLYSGRWTFNKYVVNYLKVDGKWFFSDALREGGRRNGGVYSNEVKMTEIVSEKGRPIPYLERLNRDEEFVDVTGVYDEGFWKSYNTIPMSEKLSESMQQYKTAQKAEQVFNPRRMQELQLLRDSVALAERIAQAEEEAMELEEEFKLDDLSLGEPGIERRRKRKFRLESMWGLGSHIIHTPENQVSISYLDEEMDASLISTDNIIGERNFEAIYATDFNLVMNDRWFLRFSGARDFGRTIYRESSSGLGVQFNLSRTRPVFFKLSAQHNSIRYARVAGIFNNGGERIQVGNKNFNSDRIRTFYGSRIRSLKLTGEVTVELSKKREIYLRASYYMPYSEQQEVHFRETSIFFRKKARLDADSRRVAVTSNDEPFNGSLFKGGSIQATIGYVFK